MKPPCIRGLKVFKDGCPQKMWDGEEGCSAWVEMTYESDDPAQATIIIKACLDIVTFDLQLKAMKLLEGNQLATEGLKNGLCEVIDGKTEPKPNVASTQLMQLLTMKHNSTLIEG